MFLLNIFKNNNDLSHFNINYIYSKKNIFQVIASKISGIVRQSHTHLKVPRSYKPMMRRFGITQLERLYVFAYKSVCFEDVFRD